MTLEIKEKDKVMEETDKVKLPKLGSLDELVKRNSIC